MIQHMNLVFQAAGLKVGEGAFLMACANHTDDKGYVIAHMQQLADEAHMSLRSARDQRAALEKRGLLKAKDRYSPKNGAQIANLFRINLTLLASMQRKPKDYGPSLVEELTFDAPPASDEENRRSDPPADFAPPPGGGGGRPPPAPARGGGGGAAGGRRRGRVRAPGGGLRPLLRRRFRTPPGRSRRGRGCEICRPSPSFFFSLFSLWSRSSLG
ncbi:MULTISPECIES: hypothetical protein [Streptomyces]|uniref:Uncharacterized protein n=2 Tax=Streptomyces TaxID=1883 RepID=A0ABU4KDL8_9ACTN|nr:hypothetical protein [Streptomyces roseolus]MDX2295868.1 hypothetical protein [Streptomyces roseolus]